MNEIQRLLVNTIEKLNVTEKRDNKPRFSISFIRKHPWLFICMYIGLFATLWVMLASEILADYAWLLIVLFALLNLFFFLDVNPRYRYSDIDVLDLRVCYNGEWYNTRHVPHSLIDEILQSSQVNDEQKLLLNAMLKRKKELSFYDVYSLTQQSSLSVHKN